MRSIYSLHVMDFFLLDWLSLAQPRIGLLELLNNFPITSSHHSQILIIFLQYLDFLSQRLPLWWLLCSIPPPGVGFLPHNFFQSLQISRTVLSSDCPTLDFPSHMFIFNSLFFQFL